MKTHIEENTGRHELIGVAIDQVEEVIAVRTEFSDFVGSLPLDEGVSLVQELESEVEETDNATRSLILESRNMIQEELMRIHGWSVYNEAYTASMTEQGVENYQ